jgi:hypothetical protein
MIQRGIEERRTGLCVSWPEGLLLQKEIWHEARVHYRIRSRPRRLASSGAATLPQFLQ